MYWQYTIYEQNHKADIWLQQVKDTLGLYFFMFYFPLQLKDSDSEAEELFWSYKAAFLIELYINFMHDFQPSTQVPVLEVRCIYSEALYPSIPEPFYGPIFIRDSHNYF